MKKPKVSKIAIHTLLVIYAFISLYPLFWMFTYSFKNNEEIFVSNPFGLPKVWRTSNYSDALSELNIAVYFQNSIFVAFASIVLTVFFALMFCYVVSRIRTPFTKMLHSLIMSGLFIPIQAAMIPLVLMVKRFGLTNSLWSIIIPYTAIGLPFACMLLYGFYLSIPLELEESSYLEGANFGRTYFTVILPQMSSAVSVLIIYQFMASWNEFNLALILLTKDQLKTLPLALANLSARYSANWGMIGAAMMIASAPLLIGYMFFSKRIIESMAASGIKG